MNDETLKAKRQKKLRSRWSLNHTRYSVNTMIDDIRWLKNKKGQWRKKEDNTDELSYNLRRRERPGFRQGARITRLIHATQTETANGSI